jgi:hypothetical protein
MKTPLEPTPWLSAKPAYLQMIDTQSEPSRKVEAEFSTFFFTPLLALLNLNLNLNLSSPLPAQP